MIEDNKKIEFVKDTIGTQEKYNTFIVDYGFSNLTNSEKDILLQASVNVHEYEIDESLIFKAFNILVSLKLKNTSSLNEIDIIENIEKTLASKKNKKIPIYVSDSKIEKIDSIMTKLVIGGIVLFAFVWIITPSNNKDTINTSSKQSKYNQYGDVHGAWAYMQIFVEKRLKSPKSADFPFGGGSYHTTDLGGGRYKVNSYVDSQNAFGANIRTHFDGVIKRKDGGWILEYLNFRNN